MATKKTTKEKKPKMVTIKYDPVGFTAGQMNIPLRTKSVSGEEVPLVEGLPTMISLNRGQTMTVTPEQLKKLQAMRIVESDEERKARELFIKNIPDQYADTGSDENSEAIKARLTQNDLQSKIYNDRLIICD